MKLMIFIGTTIFGTLGGWIGAALSNGNWFGPASILLGAVGSLFGIWVGFKFARDYLGL